MNIKAIRRELEFRTFARQSGEILCTEPTGPPVELIEQPHGKHELFDGAPCENCGACV